MFKAVLSDLCLLFAGTELGLWLAFGVTGDTFFFRSDAGSAIIFTGFVGFILFAVLAAVYLAIVAARPRIRGPISSGLERSFLALIPAGLVYFVINAVDGRYDLTIRTKVLFSDVVPWLHFEFAWWLFFAAIFVFFFRRFKGRERDIFAYRSRKVAIVMTVVGLVAFSVSFSSARNPGDEVRPGDERHLVLIVLDGWPYRYLDDNRSHARRPILRGALEFTNVRTSAVWTFSHFGALYSGVLRHAFYYEDRSFFDRVFTRQNKSEKNLLSALQRSGVFFRGFFHHRCGVPEGTSIHTSHYDGLRSVLLNRRHVGLLEHLGLQFAMLLSGPTASTSHQNDMRSYAVSRLIPGLRPEEEAVQTQLSDFLLPRMETIQRRHDRTLIVFHVPWNSLSGEEIPSAFGISSDAYDEVDKDEMADAFAKAMEADNHYDEEDRAYFRLRRARRQDASRAALRRIRTFAAQLRESGALDDTAVIITADHGSISSRGKVAYGFHPDEEVTRVPLFVFGLDREGVDPRAFDTTDVTQSVLDYFNVSDRFHPKAQSIFDETAPGKSVVFSVTQRSDLRKEWFLVVYKDGWKYVANIHPAGDGSCRKYSVDRFQVKLDGLVPVRAIEGELRDAFMEYDLARLRPSKVHRTYQRFLRPSDRIST